MTERREGFYSRLMSSLARRQIDKRVHKIETIYENRLKEIRDFNNPKTRNGSSVTSKLNKFFLIVKRKLGLNRYYNNPYDFKALRSAYENEAYVRRATDHYTETVMRNGYSIVGENEDNVLYIKRRLSEFEMVSGIGTEENIRNTVPQFLLYGNCISSLSRTENASSGEEYTRFDGKKMKPIAAMYIEDSRSIDIKNDSKRGLVYKRRYDRDYTPTNPSIENIQLANGLTNFALSSISNSFTIFPSSGGETASTLIKDNIYHIGFHRHPGDVWAAPPYAAALDDIRTLRSIEENVELLVFQYGHGILHAKVGDEKRDGTEPEIIDLKLKIEDMEANGFLVTDNRVELAIKGVEGNAVDVSKYLNYFKNRVFSGLYMSDVGMGESNTSNRSTADSLGKDSIDRTNEIQRYVSELYNKLFKELLLERGRNYKEVNDEKNRVYMTFPEVDIASKIKVEEHYTNMYAQNVITLDETREKIGEKKMDELAEQRLFSTMVTGKQTEEEGNILKEVAKLKPAAGSLSTNSGAKKTQGAINKSNQRKRPVNQHGKSVAPAVKKDSAEYEEEHRLWDDEEVE